MHRRPPLFFVSVLLLAAGCASVEKSVEHAVDLSSPEATVVGFTRAAAAGNAKLAQAHFLPGGVDYEDVLEVLTAAPSSPSYPGRLMFESVDPQAPITVLSQEETEYGLAVVWRATFAKGFEIEGHKIEPGATYDFDATLRKTRKGWLIDNL